MSVGDAGYSRDKRRGSLQIVYGLLCDRAGRPVAIEAYQGNTIDSQTVQSQITKMKDRFALDRAVLVSDRRHGHSREPRCTERREPRLDNGSQSAAGSEARGGWGFAALPFRAAKILRKSPPTTTRRATRDLPEPASSRGAAA